MSSMLEAELRRERWRRHLAVEELDRSDQEEFSLGGLGSYVEFPTTRLLLLPPDPDTDTVEFDDQFWEWLQEQKNMQIGDGQVHLGHQIVPGPHTAALAVESGDCGKWKSYTAVHRNGTIEVGLGDRGGRVHSASGEEATRYFWLKPAVAFTWAIGELARTMPGGETEGPFLLAIALRDTKGGRLGHFGEGWQEPWQGGFLTDSLRPCQYRHLLWHIEVDQLPSDTPTAQALAFSAGDRIDNAWRCRSRRYLDHRGTRAGQFVVQGI